MNCKIPKYSDTQKIAVIILKFEHCNSTIDTSLSQSLFSFPLELCDMSAILLFSQVCSALSLSVNQKWPSVTGREAASGDWKKGYGWARREFFIYFILSRSKRNLGVLKMLRIDSLDQGWKICSTLTPKKSNAMVNCIINIGIYKFLLVLHHEALTSL